MGRGTRRRRRKRGEVRTRTREQMTCRYRGFYTVTQPLVAGDVFVFQHRHKLVDLRRSRMRNKRLYSYEDYLDFPRGSIVVWMGRGGWYSDVHHYFEPRPLWWDAWLIHLKPVSVQLKKQVHLRLVK